ncbi:MAG: TetR family transcriptional regulator, partial [Parasporobacterium sp.]|nr:TetR family transcriptional regulator [Parasporobacterium sp.]
RRVTVREIVQRARIHRSTFYIYFEAVEDIFSAIKKRQLSLLEEVLAAEGEGEDRFIGLLNSLREVYEENRIFLKPLVIDYHSSSFSRAYRQILKNALKKDGNLPDYPEGSSEYIILDSVMSGYIEMLLQLLDSGVLSMKEAFRFAYYTMENGTKPALQKQFGIS